MTWQFELRATHQPRLLSRVLQILDSQMVCLSSLALRQEGLDAAISFTIASPHSKATRIQALLYRLQDVHSVRLHSHGWPPPSDLPEHSAASFEAVAALTDMRLASVNCGLPRKVDWHGATVTTSIFKEPVSGRIALRPLNLEGDRQADLSVHGGQYKAVYCYPLRHYEYWAEQLPGQPLPLGSFGENFTIDGDLDEHSIHIGDRFAVGSAEVIVTQPRLPCYKLGIRFAMDDMPRRFLASGRSGFYLAVTREGEVGVGDAFTLLAADPAAFPVSAVSHLHIATYFTADDLEQVRRARTLSALPESWKTYFQDKANRLRA